MEAYCLKCKKKQEIDDPEPVVLKNGRLAMKGTCPECGTNVMKFGGGATGAKLGSYCKPS
jgi:hypothetical protein